MGTANTKPTNTKKKHRKNVQKIQKIFKMSEHHKTPTTTSITIIPANCMRTENTKNFLSLFLVQRLTAIEI